MKLLRRFKDELYTFALTQQPGPMMRVAALDDSRIDENTLALSIGLTSTGVYGLARAVNAEQWYSNIILHDSVYPADQMLQYVYPELVKQNSWKLPCYYYMMKSTYKSELAEEKAPKKYSDIVSDSSVERNKKAIAGRTALEIWNEESKDNLTRAIRLLGFLPQDKVNVNDYQNILDEMFTENPNILTTLNGTDKSNLKKIIRIYDLLRYGRKKTP